MPPMMTVSLADGAMPCCAAIAPGGQPGVLIIPSVLGLDTGCTALVERFVRSGVSAVAPDLFWRVAAGPLPPEERGLALERADAADPRQLLRDLIATRRWLGDQGAGPIIALGVGFGGRFAMLTAARGAVAGAITWSGGGLIRLIDLSNQISCPLSMHFGEDDDLIPRAEVARLQNTLGTRDDVSIHLHPGAGHGFAQRGHPNFSPVPANAAFADALRTLERLSGLRLRPSLSREKRP
ncbi:MAG: carboxymethylenebutenolidase [Myxococcota bacterium]|jgi:carboxymethylenebutenolidase